MFGIHTVGIDLKNACSPDPLQMGDGKLKVISQKYNKLVDTRKKNLTRRQREHAVVTSRHGRRAEGGKIGLGEQKAQTIRCQRFKGVSDNMTKQPMFITANGE